MSLTQLQSKPVAGITRLRHLERAHATNIVSSSDLGAPDSISASEPAGLIEVQGYVRAEIAFFGVGSNDQAGTYDLYGIRVIGNNPRRNDSPSGNCLYTSFLLGSGTFALSSGLAGVASGYLSASELLADTLVWTADSDFTTYLDALVGNSIVEYSPGDDAHIGLLAIPDLAGFHGIVIDVAPTTATSVNALVSLWT